jgi:hypothetical protein
VENGWRDCVGESEVKVGATTLPRTVPFPFFESCREIWNCCRQVSAETSPSYQDSFTLIRLQEEVNWEVGIGGLWDLAWAVLCCLLHLKGVYAVVAVLDFENNLPHN